MKHKAQNIFICYTPLHILISEKIIQEEKIDSFVFIFYVEKDNAKSKYYYNKLALAAEHAFYIKKNNKVFSALKTFCYLYLKLRKYSGSSFFTGNLKSAYSRIVIFLLGFGKLYTFDDGIGNVWGNGYFYYGREPSVFARVLSFIKLDFTYSRMYSSICRNYTIYNLPNVMPHSVYLRLFERNKSENSLNNEDVTILLTSTLCEHGMLTIEQEQELYNKVIKKFYVTHVISHPLEKIKKITDPRVKIIDSEKIAEEIILEMRQKYNKIKVLGVYSSALINLKQIADIEVINIHFDFGVSSEDINKILVSAGIYTYSI